MKSNIYLNDDIDIILNHEQKDIPNVELSPREDTADTGYKLVSLLADDLTLDLSELDLDGIN